VQAGAYQEATLWLSDGWSAVCGEGWTHPYYWRYVDGRWYEFTLNGLRELNPAAPASHISYYEADAYATWCEARLPSEFEWERVAESQAPHGNFMENGTLHPAAAGTAASDEPAQMFGDLWEWTRSAYAPYPGYTAPSGAIGEYNGKFMCNQYVLRGGACVTPASHIRASYRNFFYPHSRWQFSGVRLARDGAV